MSIMSTMRPVAPKHSFLRLALFWIEKNGMLKINQCTRQKITKKYALLYKKKLIFKEKNKQNK